MKRLNLVFIEKTTLHGFVHMAWENPENLKIQLKRVAYSLLIFSGHVCKA